MFFHSEIVGAVHHQGADLLEGTFIEKEVDALPGSQFALLVLLINPVLSAAQIGLINLFL